MLLQFLLAVLIRCHVATAASPSSSSSSSSSAAASSDSLQDRVARSLDYVTGRPDPRTLSTLRGTADRILSTSECALLSEALPPANFALGGRSGYEDNEGSHFAAPVAYSGLDLAQLARPARGGFETEGEYGNFLNLRERIRSETEQALGLPEGTLRVDYTQIAQKGVGGRHRPHADSCYHYYDDGKAKGGVGLEEAPDPLVRCDRAMEHPYPHRVAASIVYLNDGAGGGYSGGEFYWADHHDGSPAVVVRPRPGRMAYFTAGVENLHGALPVQRLEDCNLEGEEGEEGEHCGRIDAEAESDSMPRRLAIAMWYSLDEPAEPIPPFAGKDGEGDENGDAPGPYEPFQVLKLPVASLRAGGLGGMLSFFLLGLQNEPKHGTWRFVSQEEAPLGMVFQDESAMFTIELRDDAIVVDRHVDPGQNPSLFYQLQEALVLHKLLDELQYLVSRGVKEISEEARLIQLRHDEAIQEVRKELPAKPG